MVQGQCQNVEEKIQVSFVSSDPPFNAVLVKSGVIALLMLIEIK